MGTEAADSPASDTNNVYYHCLCRFFVSKKEDKMIKLTLSEARRHAGLSRAELAQKLGMSVYLLDYYCARRHVPRADVFLNICKICNVDPYDVDIGGTKNEN